MSSIYDFYRWFRDGSIAVTNGSTDVIGTGTNWTLNGPTIRPGDILTLDGDKLYEIAAVVDDMHLTLQSAFLGTTGTGRSYSIIRNFAATPGADLVAQQIALVQASLARERQYIEWQSSPASSDPGNPTLIAFTNYDGTTTMVKSLPQLQDDIDRAIAAGQVGPPGPQGDEGPPGTPLPWEGQWSVTHGTYNANETVSNINSLYVCKQTHTAAASNQPGVGANWQTYWDVGVQNVVGPEGPEGPEGPVGETGAAGANGATWLVGTVDPVGSQGVINDLYLNTVSANVFKKTGASAWTNIGNIKGPAGANGASIVWLTNDWSTYANFAVNQAIRNANASWVCILAHARTAITEPGVGSNYATYWSKMTQDGGNNGLPPGGTINQLLIKASSTDGDAEWVTHLPDNAAVLADQDWTGSSLAQLQTRNYGDLASRPNDDNWLSSNLAITSEALLGTAGWVPYFPMSLYGPSDGPGFAYRKMDLANFKTLIKTVLMDQLTADGATSLALQDMNDVNLVGGSITTMDKVQGTQLAGNYLDLSAGQLWFDASVDGDTLDINGLTNQRCVISLNANVSINFTWPALLAGQHSLCSGRVMIKNLVSNKTITLPSADLVIGVQPTTNGAVYMLAWERVARVVSTDPFVHDEMTIFSWVY